MDEKRIYSRKEVYESTLKYFNGDDLATGVWIDKYALKDKEGNILELDPDMMHRRLAKEIARIEKNYPNSRTEDEIYSLLKDFKYFVFGGSPAFGIGNDYSLSSLGNCFVIGNMSDSYGGIMTDDQEQVQIMKRRGGVGLDLSPLRPKGTPTTNSAGNSSGAVSFAPRYSNSTKEVAQGGGRRGALMLSIHVKHPDSSDFVECKKDKKNVTYANISVKVDKEFMEAVKNGKDYIQTFPIDLNIEHHIGFMTELDEGNIEYNKLYSLQYTNDNEYKDCWAKRIKARELWEKIIHHATTDAEPGVLFWDKIIEESIPSCYGKEFIESSTNPCGELPLPPYDSCRLSSLNLYSYVDHSFTNEATFNWNLFKDHCHEAMRIMDDFVDLELEKINQILDKVNNDQQNDYIKIVEIKLWERIREKLIQGRRTGLGITGEGDMLTALGLRYGTEEANKFSIEVHKTMAIECYKATIELAKERGAFPIWDWGKEKNNLFINRIQDELSLISGVSVISNYQTYGRRNISCLTIAPNGTLSLMTQTTSGIEPCFEITYKRRRKIEGGPIIDEVGDHWEEYTVFHSKFVEWYRINKMKEKYSYEECLMDLQEINNTGDIALKEIIKDSPYYKATANEIDYLKKVEMQGEIQKWIDHSISVTHNLPKGISEEEVSKIYMKAYEVGCKGCTVYVDGSRSGVLIKEEKKQQKFIERPEDLLCDIYSSKVKGKEWIVLVGIHEGRPLEVFAFKQKNLKITHDLPNARLIKRKVDGKNYYDLLANSHFKLEDIASLFEKGEEQSLTRSISLNLRYRVPIVEVIDQLEKATGSLVELSAVLIRALKNYIKQEKIECPNCHSEIHPENGCLTCKNCGWSKCG